MTRDPATPLTAEEGHYHGNRFYAGKCVGGVPGDLYPEEANESIDPRNPLIAALWGARGMDVTQLADHVLSELRRMGYRLTLDRERAEAARGAVPERRKCSCGGRRWVDDENWTPDDPRHVERTKHDGLIPCGSCNEGGWDTPEWEPEPPLGHPGDCSDSIDYDHEPGALGCIAPAATYEGPLDLAVAELLSALPKGWSFWQVSGWPAIEYNGVVSEAHVTARVRLANTIDSHGSVPEASAAGTTVLAAVRAVTAKLAPGTPEPQLCPRCDGRGWYPDAVPLPSGEPGEPFQQPCGDCDGTGVLAP